jgi:hypothetical protein
MIEMHLGEDPLGDGDDDLPVYPSRAGRIWRLAWSTAALAIASLVMGLASLTIIEASEEIGETALFSSHANTPSELTQIKVSAFVRLVIAVIGIALALAAALRFRDADSIDPDDDDELDAEPDPSWVGGVVGAGFLVSIIAAIVAATSLIYALSTHLASGNGFG